ncbi:MAG TPA: hypothetical protein VL688_09265 [Verrucomicrobiae bacterium]|nr:hypothetical protein [Verrucomicrobiae bacterium]
MKKNPNQGPRKPKKKNTQAENAAQALQNALSLHSELAALKKDAKKRTDENKAIQERIQDIEIHVNLLTRLLTTLCVEKFGMRVGVLKRLIKRIEKEAIRDSQILHLESLYNLSPNAEKKDEETPPPAKDDPWEDIA